MVDVARQFVVFAGDHRIAAGSLAQAAVAAKRTTTGTNIQVTILNYETGEATDLDLRGSFAEVTRRYSAPAKARRGRPKLGVTAREVTLLPRHWDWLARQPGGASAALRRMIDAARKAGEGDNQPAARDAAYRLMVNLAGNRIGFEEASRALYRGDDRGLQRQMQSWPPDVRLTVLERLRADIAPAA